MAAHVISVHGEHLQLALTFQEYKNLDVKNRIIDESQAGDMYEIQAEMNAYISDYSSACFKAGFAIFCCPCILMIFRSMLMTEGLLCGILRLT